MVDYLHAFRTGLIKGADFVGAYITKNSFSPGFLAREYGLISHDFRKKPYSRPKKSDMSLGERVVEVVGENIGLASNLFFFVPEIFGARLTIRANKKNYWLGDEEHPGLLLLESGMNAPAIWDKEAGYSEAESQGDRQRLIEAIKLSNLQNKLMPFGQLR